MKWWQSHFIGVDPGFGRSWAAAVLLVVEQSGRIVALDEVVLQHCPTFTFAQEIVEQFNLNGARGHHPNVVAIYMDSAAKAQVGTGTSVGDQINDILRQFGFGAIDAEKDRVGGWQLLYQLLARGQLVISDTCEMLISAIPSRVHDPKHPGDLIKVSEPCDDALDACRYACRSWMEASEKPLEVKRAEMMAEFASGLNDPSLSERERGAIMTSAAIRHAQFQAEVSAPRSARPAGPAAVVKG